jgi:uncharacterized membrane protein
MLHRAHDFRFRPWLVPSLYAAVAIFLGFALPRVEGRLLPALASPLSTAAATTIYSAIASGMIALTGIVFSLTFVMVQFSASAYSPRLALWMARDPLLAHALGMFIATFVYAIAALAWLDRGLAARVPLISSWLVVGFLLASMGMFIALIERIGLLQVNRMLTFTGNQGRRVIITTYASLEAAPSPASSEGLRALHPTQTLIHHGRPRAVQSFDIARLVELAAQQDGTIEVLASVGDTVVELTPILHVFGTGRRIPEKRLRDAVELGEQRTFHQDPKYAIRLLVDIAIKALSPAINDPTTATQALDQIGDLLVRLGLSRIEIGAFHDSGGTLRLLVPFPTWDDFLRLAFDEIRYCGANSVQVMRRMRALVSDLITVLPEERHPALMYWQQRLQGTVARSFQDADDKLEASTEDRQGLGTTRGRSAASS